MAEKPCVLPYADSPLLCWGLYICGRAHAMRLSACVAEYMQCPSLHVWQSTRYAPVCLHVWQSTCNVAVSMCDTVYAMPQSACIAEHMQYSSLHVWQSICNAPVIFNSAFMPSVLHRGLNVILGEEVGSLWYFLSVNMALSSTWAQVSGTRISSPEPLLVFALCVLL